MHVVPLLAGALALLGTFILAWRLFGQATALLAAGMLMTSFEFQRIARELVVDMTLTACVIWAWVFFQAALAKIKRGTPASGSLLGFFTAAGLACMIKGPFMVALYVVLPMLFFLSRTRRWMILSRCGLFWGIPWSLSLGLFWFVLVFLRGHDSLPFFVHENLKRMIGQADHQHYIPFLFYGEVIWENFAPWSLLIPLAIICWRRLNDKTDNRDLLFAALCVPVFLLGFAVSKRSLYLLPIYPFLAMVLARTFESMLAYLVIPFGKATTAVFAAVLPLCVLVTLKANGFLAHSERREAFYERIQSVVGDRSLIMFGESANEAVWFLDCRPTVERLARADLQTRFLNQPDTVLLVSEKILAREPGLRDSLHVIFKHRCGEKSWTLATQRVGGLDKTTRQLPPIPTE
jgi:4-amino-4-deoxy-L-arabinose transferase-like glycosyltransferase